MLVIGLTGSLGAGKSTVAALLAKAGAAVFNADQAVHDLYHGAALAPVGAAFPGTVKEGVVDRERLSARVMGDPAALTKLEAIVHPLVQEEQKRFCDAASGLGHRLVALEIPLLVETGGADRVDVVVLVIAPSRMRRDRVMTRPGMSEERFAALSQRQLPDSAKRAHSHVIVDNSGSRAAAAGQVADLVRMLAATTAGR